MGPLLYLNINESFRIDLFEVRIFTTLLEPTFMSAAHIPYPDTGYFSKTVCDYLAQQDALKPFYNRFPKLSELEDQIAEKKDFSGLNTQWRKTLSETLLSSYGEVTISGQTLENIQALKEEHTFTITTGHQLNLFSGPLYFLYKIVSVINFCKQAKAKFPNYNFVPVYWMATEDHDFDEINYFNFKGSKIIWNREDGGAVGDLDTNGLDEVYQVIKAATGSTDNALAIQQLFEQAYLNHSDLASATRFLANSLFADEGLVIVDGNHSELKRAFTSYAKKELFEQTGFKTITETTDRLVAAGYKEQVHPREINLFYLDKGIRERIIQQGEKYYVNNTQRSFSAEEITALLESNPEQFSPNALLRPLFQEVILPNLCYIGGGGELAYWLQLKDYFAAVGVPFPMLMLRNSAMLITQKQSKKLAKLDLNLSEFFKKPLELSNYLVAKHSDLPLDFSSQKQHLKAQFEHLYDLAKQTDASFVGAVAAQEKKQLNGLERLENRLRRAEKRNHKDRLDRTLALKEQLFPSGSLQERNTNFSEFYLEHGPALISTLLEELDPFKSEFTVVHL